MKRLSPLLLLFIVVIPAYSQDCDSLNRKFDALYNSGNIKQLIEIATEAKNICGLNGDMNLKYAIALDNLLVAYYLNGKFEDAIPIGEECAQIRRQILGPKDSLYATSLNNLAAIYMRLNNDSKALDLNIQALKIREESTGNNSIDYAQSLNNISILYTNMGIYQKALVYGLEATEILKVRLGENNSDYFLYLENVASLYTNMDSLQKALPLLQKSLLFRKTFLDGFSREYAWALTNMGILYGHIGDFKKSLQFLTQALKLQEVIIGKNHVDYALTLYSLSRAYSELGNDKYALSLSTEALMIQKKNYGIYHRDCAETLVNIGIINYRMQNINQAKYHFQKAINILNKVLKDDNPEYYEDLHYLGEIFLEFNDFKKASNIFEDVAKFRSTYWGRASSNFGISLFSFFKLYLRNDEIKKAYSNIIELNKLNSIIAKNKLISFTEKQQQFVLRKNMQASNAFNSLMFIHPEKPEKFNIFSNTLLLKSLSLNETKKSISAIRNSSDTSVQNMFQNFNGIKNYLSKQYTLPISKQASNLKEKETEAQDIEQQLALKSAEYRRFEQSINITASDIYQALKPGEAAIEFTSFRFHNKYGWTDSTLYAAIILNAKDSVPHWVYLFEEKQLKKLLFTTHPNLLYSNAKMFTSTQQQYGDKLYNIIWKKIEPKLAGINTVYYSPSGILNQVALTAIPFAASNKTISNKYKMVQMGSTKNIVVHELEVPVTNIALMGGISYNADSVSFAVNTTDSSFGNTNIYTTTIMRGTDKATKSFEYLPATLTEVNSITATATAAAIVTNVYTEHNATEEAFKKMDGHSPSVLHIATHGFYLPYKNKKATDDLNQTNFSLIEDPMLRSGIALAGANLKWSKNIDVPNREDGIVTAYEIAQMDLSKTELVVLSACESGLGDIDGSEGVFGLQRGFKSAGVNKLILTLWQVPDKATMEFMTLFYNKWLKEKKDIRTSFVDTQKTMSEKYKAEPYKWAGFVLIE